MAWPFIKSKPLDNRNPDVSDNYALVERNKQIYAEIEKLNRLKHLIWREKEFLKQKEEEILSAMRKPEHGMEMSYKQAKEIATKLDMKFLLRELGDAEPVDMLKLSKKRVKLLHKLDRDRLDSIDRGDIRGMNHFIHHLELAVDRLLQRLNLSQVERQNSGVASRIRNFLQYAQEWEELAKQLAHNTMIYKMKNGEIRDTNERIRTLREQLKR